MVEGDARRKEGGRVEGTEGPIWREERGGGKKGEREGREREGGKEGERVVGGSGELGTGREEYSLVRGDRWRPHPCAIAVSMRLMCVHVYVHSARVL